MINPSRTQFPTTAQQIAAANSRHLLESEPRPAFDLSGTIVVCTNPDAMPGQRKYTVVFTPKDQEQNHQSFDGRNWSGFPV